MRHTYMKRHQDFHESARSNLGGLLDVQPTETGLYTLGQLRADLSENDVVARAQQRRITVAPIQRICLEAVETHGLVLGSNGVKPAELITGVETLAEEAEARMTLV